MPIIADNITALNAWRQLDSADTAFASSMEKLSSGLRINSPADDPAGSVRAEQLQAEIVGIQQGVQNTQDAVSMIQTAGGALNEQTTLLNDMRALALHAMNSGVADSSSIAADQAQIDQAVASLDSLAQNTKFAGKSLLNGDASNLGTIVNSSVLGNVSMGATAPSGTNLVGVSITTGAVAAAHTISSIDLHAGLAGGETITINGQVITMLATNTQATLTGLINGNTTLAGMGITANTRGNFTDIIVAAGSDHSMVITSGGDGNVVAAGTLAAQGSDQVGTGTQAKLVNTLDVVAAGTAAGAGVTDTLNINGQSVAVTVNNSTHHTVADVVAQINTALGSGSSVYAQAVPGANAGNQIEFLSRAYGSSQTVSINDASHLLFAGNTFNTANGADVQGTINAQAATGSGLTLTANTGTAYAGTAVTFNSTAAVGAYANAFQATQGELVFQVGSDAADSVTTSIANMSASQLGTTAAGLNNGGLNSIKTGGVNDLATNATQALAVIDEAITDVSDEQSKLGSVQKYVLDTKINSLNVANENVTASKSRITDVDMALEMTNFTKEQILQQAATAMLAQANSAPQSVLQLLKG